MQIHLKSWLLMSLLLLVLVPTTSASSEVDNSSEILTSPTLDGIWVNETLILNGSTTLNPQNVDWVLYDVTDPYLEWPILRSGEFFSVVTPVAENLWIWSLTIDVSGLNCTCWLEIGQPNGLGKEFLNRIIFIGLGPHDPMISPYHPSSIMVDNSVEIATKAVLSDSNANDSNIILSWCYAPNGACDGVTNSKTVSVDWEGNSGSFEINATELELTDGLWDFNYYLQDSLLKNSPDVSISVYVDRTNPISSLICPNESSEGQNILIDGSGSNDGVWSNNLQYVWYINSPEGNVYVPNTNDSQSVLNIELNESGEYMIRLDVIDWVGRMNSTVAYVTVDNVIPVIEFEIEGVDVRNPNSWQFSEGDNLSLHPSVIDPGDENSGMSFYWYLDDELVSEFERYSVKDLEVGEYNLLLIVEDDDGANASYEMDLIVKSSKLSDSESTNYTALISLLIIITVAVIMSRRLTSVKSKPSSLPKWKEKVSQSTSGEETANDEESELWD